MLVLTSERGITWFEFIYKLIVISLFSEKGITNYKLMKRTVNSLKMCKIIKLHLLPFREVLINIENILLEKELYLSIPHINSFCNWINIYLGPIITMLDAWNTTIKMAKILFFILTKKADKWTANNCTDQ